MNIPRRKAVSPIIATLLLIAIAVAAGIIVYVFVGGLSTSLTKSGGSQITEQISVDAYNFPGTASATTSPGFLTLYLRNTGSSTGTISTVFYDGNLLAAPAAQSCTPVATVCYFYKTCATANGCTLPAGDATVTVSAGGVVTIEIDSGTLTSSTTPPLPSAGTSHSVKIVTADGGTFSFSVIAGSSG